MSRFPSPRALFAALAFGAGVSSVAIPTPAAALSFAPATLATLRTQGAACTMRSQFTVQKTAGLDVRVPPSWRRRSQSHSKNCSILRAIQLG